MSPTTSLSDRHNRLVEALARRNNKRFEGRTHTVWPVLFSDILLAAIGLALISFWLFDAAAITMVRSWDPAVIGFFRSITDIGTSGWILVPTGIACLLLVLVDWRSLAGRQQVWLSNLLFDSWFLFLAVAGSGLIVNALKLVFGRARPRHFDTLGAAEFEPFRFESSFAGFPSGHSATIAALAVFVALRFPRLRWPAIALALLIGTSRVVSGAHYPSDVIAGLTLGALFSLALARGFANRKTGFRFTDAHLRENAVPRRYIVRGYRPHGFSEILDLGRRLTGLPSPQSHAPDRQ